MPCMWSGMAMMTASMFFCSLSSILRKSVYFTALSYRSNIWAALTASGSQSATIFSEEQP